MIKVLSESVINKIAAGEVVERPANVIKELLENSFDSGADEIKIEIIDSGLKKIKITDNGSGMNADDLLLSYKRHATSKISNENDLYSINSFGFRGEALASIAEVSNLKITTKPKNARLGAFLEVEGGKLIKEEVVGSFEGTIVEVSDLFFNVPPRKKFLKSPEIEFLHILDIVTRYALIKKEILIRLYHNSKDILNSQKTEYLLNNIISIYGAEVGKNLIEINYSTDDIKIEGYISRPSLTRADKNDQSLYVNSRHVKDNGVSNAIYEAYKTLLFIHRHPIFILNIIVDPSSIDVNVHPAKTVVKFKNESKIYNVLFDAIKDSFKKTNMITDVDLESESNSKPINQYDFNNEHQTILQVKDNVIASKSIVSSIVDEKINEVSKKERLFDNFKILGQVNKTFIIAESLFGLAIIDQHAAEERVNYEKFMNELKDKAIKKQNFLSPKIIELNPIQYLASINNKEFLDNLGFDFDAFSNNTLKLISVPVIFERLKSTIFIDILNELVKLKNEIITTEIENRIIRFACRESIKAGDELTIIQLKKLLEDLGKTDNPYSCPHGRPTIINLSLSELERKFKRSGWT